MDKTNEERVCENCKYFVAYYIKKSSYFQRIAGGHCINSVLNKQYSRNKYSLHENCQYWESNESKKEEAKKKIEKVIIDMHERLNEIKQILEDE